MRMADIQRIIVILLLLLIGGVLSNGSGRITAPATLPGTFVDGTP